MSDPIYLNNAATTWPKPECVYETVDQALRNAGAPRRSAPGSAGATDVVDQTRRRLAAFLDAPNPDRLLLMPGCTHGLSMAILGREWNRGDVIVMSGLEHHGVSRPARRLMHDRGVEIRISPYAPDQPWDLTWLEEQLNAGGVRMVCTTAASNLTGQLTPYAEVTTLAKQHGSLALVDGAQIAGVLPVSIAEIGCDFFSFAGHKALFGPPGVGGLYVAEDAPLKPLIEGGTGGDSGDLDLELKYPAAYEAGTINHPAIAGLGAGVAWLEAEGLENIHARESELTSRLIAGLDQIEGLTRYGPRSTERRTSAVSFNLEAVNCHELAAVLASEAGIVSRAGYHCSPLSHMTVGSHALGGALRLSPGYFTSEQEIDTAIDLIAAIAREPAV